jgi:8-oxo-dGTP diphosphatase
MIYAQMSVSERRLLPPAVAVSTVAFALHPPARAQVGTRDLQPEPTDEGATLWLPLVRRTRAPFSGDWALPGGPIPWNETLASTAVRTLREAARSDPGYLEQLYSFGAVERSADAQRLVTIAYWALYADHSFETTSDIGEMTEPTEAHTPEVHDPNVAWFSADRLPRLAFDHKEIVAHALDRLRSKTEYSTVAYRFLGPRFTLTQLREVHEAVLGDTVDPANFRRQALAQGHLIDTGEVTSGARHRPARLYRFREPTDQPTRNLS